MDPPAARCKGASRPGMPRDKSKNGAVEFFGICLRRAVSTTRKLDQFGAGDQSCELPTEIGRGEDIVFGADHQCRYLQLRQISGTIEFENSVDSAGDNLGGRKRRNGAFLTVFKQTDVLVDPPAWIEKDRGRANVGRRTNSCKPAVLRTCGGSTGRPWSSLRRSPG